MRAGLLLGIVAILSCAGQPNSSGASTQVASDTLRGIFTVEGNDPYPVTTLRTSAGRIIVDGVEPSMLKLAQLDLWLSGVRDANGRFKVNDYRVRGANGARAWDGTLMDGPNGLHLDLGDGFSHPVRGGPASFSRLIGSRIWLTENPDGTVRQYGVI
jgi:hypothetical protein